MAVSFSASTKAEVCKANIQRPCCALAQCFGILLFCNSFTHEGIRIVTESREFSQSLPKLFRKAFDVRFDLQPEDDAPGKLVFQITDRAKIARIMDAFGFDAGATLRSM